jgi:protein-tyrosine phosphatase
MPLDGFETVMPARERLLPLEGGINFRDLGGYRGLEGKAVRWGKLFRSGRMDRLTGNDQQRVGALGLDLVVDFRAEAERLREPSRWGAVPAPRTETVNIVPGSAEAFFAAGGVDGPESGAAFMTFIYRDFVKNQTAAYRTMFARILEIPDAKVLIHCAAGKDRTGFGSALLLSLLGVATGDILDDYLLTGRFLDTDRELAHVLTIAPHLLHPPMTRETIRPMFEVRRGYLEAALQAMVEDAGSVEAYAETRLGVGAAERAELRRRYLA